MAPVTSLTTLNRLQRVVMELSMRCHDFKGPENKKLELTFDHMGFEARIHIERQCIYIGYYTLLA